MLTKKAAVKNAREYGWSIGKRHLCPVCTQEKGGNKN
jgi:hypothetical protein